MATFSFDEAQTPAATGAPPTGPVAFPGGGGVLPDGSATQDPAVWSRWLQQGSYGAAQPAQGATRQTPTPGAGSPATFSFDEASAPASKPADADKKTGLLANIGAGTSEAVADTLGAPVDLAAGALNLGSRGIKAATGIDFGKVEHPIGGSESLKTAMGVVGADPRNIVPADDMEQLGRAGGAGAASMVLPWSIARSLPVFGGLAGAAQQTFGAGSAATQGAAGAAGAVAGQVAQNAVPDAYKPYANLAGNMLGGGAVLGSVAASKALIDQGATMAGNFLAPLTEAGRQRLARQRIAGAATDLPAVQQALDAPQAQLVPGSSPTTFQLTGDPGLGGLERAVATRAPDQFNALSAANNEARVATLQGLAPADASPEAVGQAFRAQLDRLTAAGDLSVGGARTAAQNATARLGGAMATGADQQATALQRYGQAIRGDAEGGTGLAGANAAARAAEGRLWQAIDPDGSLTVSMRPVREAAAEIQRTTPQNSGLRETAAWPLLSLARLQKAVTPFSELAALRSRITDAMSTELRSNGRTQAYGSMSQLLGAVHDAMAGGFEEQAAADAQEVANGAKAPDETITARVADSINQADAGGRGASGAGSEARPPGAVGADDVSGGTASASAGRSRGPGRNPGLAAAPADGVGKPQSLLSFLIARGGIRDESGELAAMNARTGRPGLVNRKGLTHDYAREAAVEAGYLPPDADVNDLRTAIGEELQGRKVYRPDEAPASADAAARNQRAYERARSAVTQAEDDSGARLTAAEVEHATQMTMMGMHPEQALHEAALAGQDRALGVDVARRAFGRPGVPEGASQAEFDVDEGASSTAPTFDAAAAGRYQAARQATAQRHATFTNAPGVGAILKPGRIASEYAMGASQVPSAVFMAGKGAAERVQAYIKAGGDMDTLGDYAAFELRRAAERDDGTIDPAKFARWKASHVEAMDAFPDLGRRFETAAAASRSVEAAVADRAASIKDYEASAAGRFLGDADPVATFGRILRSPSAAAQVADLARRTADDPAARAGLKRAAVETLLHDVQSTRLLADSEVGMLSNHRMQLFARDRMDALRPLFSPDEIASIRRVAEDVQRADRSVSAVRLPGGSNTAQDLAAGAKHGSHGQSTLTQIVLAEAVGDAAEHVAGPAGKAAGVVSLVLNAMRQAGLKKVDDLVTEAMLHPEIARTLLMQAPNRGSAKLIGQTLRSQLRALSLQSAATTGRDQPSAVRQPPYGLATPPTAQRVSAFAGMQQ